MDVIILLILLIASCVGLLMQNMKIKKLKNYIDTHKPIPNIDIDTDPFGANSKTKTRRGIIKQNWTETSASGDKTKHETCAEVEEIENLGKLSRIKIINITGANATVRNVAKDQMPEIVEQNIIEFF